MAFRELDYQDRALKALEDYLDALKPEKVNADQILKIRADNPGVDIPLPDYPARAWETLKVAGKLPARRSQVPYSPRTSGDGQPVPNATLKVPTGGGKTSGPKRAVRAGVPYESVHRRSNGGRDLATIRPGRRVHGSRGRRWGTPGRGARMEAPAATGPVPRRAAGGPSE